MAHRLSQPSLLRNILAGSASLVYAAIIGIIMAPAYIAWLGKEAYGLIAFAAVLQGWLALLDLGLTQSFTREVARYRGGALPGADLRQILRALAVITLATAVLIAVSVSLGSGYIAHSWLKIESLSPTDAAWCVACMGLAIATRWPLGLARGIITGSEEFVWLGGATIILATLRAFGVFGAFVIFGSTPFVFFVWQAAVSVIELAIFARRARTLIPTVEAGSVWSWQPLRTMLRFSLGIAFLSAVWAGATQLDRLILSTLLPLSDYAVYALAVLAASGVTFAVAPITSALQPRLARIAASRDTAGTVELYRRGSHLVAVVAGPLAAVMATQAEAILYVWTGDRSLAHTGALIAALYAIGNGLLAIAAFQFYLQFAYGDVRLNIWANIGYILIFLPTTVFAVLNWGAIGAGWAWLAINAMFLFAWTPIVHARFIPGMHRAWLRDDVGWPLAVAATTSAICSLIPRANGRISLAIQLVATGIVVAFATSALSRVVAPHLIQTLRRLHHRQVPTQP